jgi:small subunit ribosomal protein S6
MRRKTERGLHMRYYETLYLINPNIADEDYREVVNKFNSFVEKNKGVVIKVDEWGKKTLAYNVKKFDKGYYVLLQYCGEPVLIEKLQRDLKLDDRVIKYQTVKLSDNEDPEVLKARAEEGKSKATEATETEGEIDSEKEAETGDYNEGENGVQ